MKFDDLRLRTKSLIPLGIMGLTVIGMVTFGAVRLVGVSKAAGDIIEKRDVAVFQISRAGRAIVQIPYAVDAGVLNDGHTAASLAAEKDIVEAPALAEKLFTEAAAEAPDRAAEILKFRDRTHELAQRAKVNFDAGAALPGVDRGAELKPAELDALAKATKAAGVIDADSRVLLADLVAYDDKFLVENSGVAQALYAQSHNAVVALCVIGALSALVATAFSFWMTASKVERPLQRLSDQMRALAGGDLTVEIEGRERGDEVGGMARVVEVFKTNAVERVSAEARASEARSSAEATRERAAAERAQDAEQQTSAMSALRDGLKRLADGNLLARLDQGFSNEFVEVRDDFNAAATKLKAALSAVAQSTGAIQSSANEISDASDNLSRRTEQQAASLEETAAALEEITATVKNSAKGAQHAAEVVANADSDAKKGAVVVRKAVEAMDAIANSSAKIGQIIGVIDEIAFQTNLLALNAGVEAARAGNSGRGFAVVASEVRALAQRSAEAAKKIKALVSTSGTQVEVGVQLVAETGQALESIIAQVSEINKVVADIASGAQEQATGLQQINSAISQMDQSTQQNATMVEESTAASGSLSQEMGLLAKLIEQFRVHDPADTQLRRDLKTVAPHAFARSAAPAARSASKPAPRPAKLAAAGGAAKSEWAEF